MPAFPAFVNKFSIFPVVFAPFVGISGNTFRIFVKAFGSALNFTEMISSFGNYYNNCSTLALSIFLPVLIDFRFSAVYNVR